MITAAAAVKGIVIDRLAQLTGTGQVLDGVQVIYALQAELTDVCVYAGGFTFDQPGENDAYDGDEVLAAETDIIGLYVRVVGKGGATVRETEARAIAIGEVISDVLRVEPRLVGPNTNTRVAGGTGDYQNTDDGPIFILALRLIATAYV